MSDYLHFSINELEGDDPAIVIALLTEAGFDGFEETTDSVQAYIRTEAWTNEKEIWMKEYFPFPYTQKFVKDTNWNAVWESNFEPVQVGNFVSIRADFHLPAAGVQHEIIITPKMSFGTGHHATTYMMMKAMSLLDFSNKKVLDFGTGTGVLAILACMLGSTDIVAIDNDRWSIENAAENFQKNNGSNIKLLLAEEAATGQAFDIILANINRNVLMDNMRQLKAQLNPGGSLLISGILVADQQIMEECLLANGLKVMEVTERSNWLLMKAYHID